MLKEPRKISDVNADHKEPELQRNQSKLDNSIAETKTKLRAMKSKLSNAEE